MFTKIIRFLALVSVTGAGVVAIAPSASAKGRVVVTARDPAAPTTRVSYADLNLATVQGERTLNHRVGYAVSYVCQESTEGAGYFEEGRCHDFAWSGARPQIDRAVAYAREFASNNHPVMAASAITLSFAK